MMCCRVGISVITSPSVLLSSDAGSIFYRSLFHGSCLWIGDRWHGGWGYRTVCPPRLSSDAKMRLATAALLPAKLLLEASAPAVAAPMLGLAVVVLRMKPHWLVTIRQDIKRGKISALNAGCFHTERAMAANVNQLLGSSCKQSVQHKE
jgi:hypothetical protein